MQITHAKATLDGGKRKMRKRQNRYFSLQTNNNLKSSQREALLLQISTRAVRSPAALQNLTMASGSKSQHGSHGSSPPNAATNRCERTECPTLVWKLLFLPPGTASLTCTVIKSWSFCKI